MQNVWNFKFGNFSTHRNIHLYNTQCQRRTWTLKGTTTVDEIHSLLNLWSDIYYNVCTDMQLMWAIAVSNNSIIYANLDEVWTQKWKYIPQDFVKLIPDWIISTVSYQKGRVLSRRNLTVCWPWLLGNYIIQEPLLLYIPKLIFQLF
jgi:hypothetical protein